MVLLVDREVHWRAQLADEFRAQQLDVVEFDTAEAALDYLRNDAPRDGGATLLAIIDVAPTDPAGRALFVALRARVIPIMMVSARRDEHQVLTGYSLGAEAFVAKPVGLRELVARARAVLRRTPAHKPDPDGPIVVGQVSLDQVGHEVRVAGRTVPMPRREFEILEMLMREAGRIVPRTTLMRALWGSSRDTKTLDVHVRNLRAKLEAGDGRRRIVTIRGVGFRFDLETNVTDLSHNATAS